MTENIRNGVPVVSHHHRQKQQQPTKPPIIETPFVQRRQIFPSYIQVASVSTRAKALCEILHSVPVPELEAALTDSGISPAPECVEEVLKLSYGSPDAVVKFFRWAGLKSKKHSQYSWNLMVDLLGKNGLFETMWDAIRSMKQEGMLSRVTFASVFGSYCIAGKFSEAVMTFDVLDRYGVKQDVVAVNSLISAICREDNQTSRALEFFEKIKGKISPDADTFAILLEGWEKEGNADKAKSTFGEMVVRVGWSPQHMSAYDAFLTTLARGSQVDEALKFLQVMKGKNCFPGMKFFTNAIDILVRQNDYSQAMPLWEIMVSSGLVPSLVMYNAMIGLLCNNNGYNRALDLLDEMVLNGAFPDSVTYNIIFQCLIRNNRFSEAASIFTEMTKNEIPPTHYNCAAAIKLFFYADDPELAIEVWSYMIESKLVTPVDEGANELLIGLSSLGRLSDVRRFFDDMIDPGIHIYESTMDKMKIYFYKKGRSGQELFDRIVKRRKAH